MPEEEAELAYLGAQGVRESDYSLEHTLCVWWIELCFPNGSAEVLTSGSSEGPFVEAGSLWMSLVKLQ